MGKRRKKREFLRRTDHLLDMSPAGRNLFISRDKQAQNRAARRLKLWMQVVIVLVVLAVAVAVGLVAALSLVPWFRSEISLGTDGSQTSSLMSAASLPEYDSMGLPVYSDDVALFVVNGDHPTWKGFSPKLEEAEGVQVDARIADAVRLMASAAREDGLALVFTQGYVTYEKQEERFEAKVKELMEKQGLTMVMAKTEAKSQEPAPGESDFQSGLCLRLDGDPATFQESKTYSWLKTNMGKYGFVFRYPEYKEDYTGRKADPTVIRYVGKKHADAMQQRGMCLEEYLDYLGRQ